MVKLTTIILALFSFLAPTHGHLRRNLAINSAEDAVKAASAEILALCQQDSRLAYKFVRLAFHDCVGGCDGCVDLASGDNNGLDVPIDALGNIVKNYAVQGVTRADIWALAALVASDMGDKMAKVSFPFKWYGRQNCESIYSECLDANKNKVSCTYNRGPARSLPSANLDSHEILDFFAKQFGLDAQETVALMGAHTFGLVSNLNSGFGPTNAGWVEDPHTMDNAYYAALVGGTSPNDSSATLADGPKDWSVKMIDNSALSTIPNKFEWGVTDNPNVMMMNADISLVRDFKGNITVDGKVKCDMKGSKACPLAFETIGHVAKYKADNMLWLEDFRDVFTYVLEFPYNEGQCSNTLCKFSPSNALPITK
jgi:Peroxidase